MRTDDFDYNLPPELIAQQPKEPRDSSRLMVIERSSGNIEHRFFSDILEYMKEGDCLVVNNTRVYPARLHARKGTGGRVEVLLLEKVGGDEWNAMTGGSRVRPGMSLELDESVSAHVLERVSEGVVRIRFEHPQKSPDEIIYELGSVPLPPYIKEEIGDTERYQTVYSKREISSASPTAGLHFTDELISKIKSKGVSVAEIELAVGFDTFSPIREDEIEKHHIHTEWFSVDEKASEIINSARKRKGRVFAVGTTVVRSLESCAAYDGRIAPTGGRTDLFVKLGYEFKVVDCLITNFHFPRSTLLVLVCAFGGKDAILGAYKKATEMRYRFLSFGDAMLIV
ncbi:MAG: tRNA preQ1(34) S-adenosylmethionine ribosyltransferase-isomerase QueA [Actinomycetota bacterium]|nr:tRNA preQ1(34) S-adenosylmethionine ribosyltransferase-isomerase QueA [Actinomycetota bacterium]